MAKSLLEEIQDALGTVGNEFWNASNQAAEGFRGIASDVANDPRYQDLGRAMGAGMSGLIPPALTELVAPGAARIADLTSERLTGHPLIFGNMTQPVVPGVSKDEANIAATKLADMQAKEAEQNMAHQQQLQDILLSKLQSESSPGTLTFSARGNDISRGQPKEEGGSFSKYHAQSEQTRAVDKLIKQGIGPAPAEMLQQLAQATTGPEAEAAKLGLAYLPEPKDPKTLLMEAYKEALRSKDVRGSLAALRGYAKLLGYSDEQLKQIFPEGL